MVGVTGAEAVCVGVGVGAADEADEAVEGGCCDVMWLRRERGWPSLGRCAGGGAWACA